MFVSMAAPALFRSMPGRYEYSAVEEDLYRHGLKPHQRLQLTGFRCLGVFSVEHLLPVSYRRPSNVFGRDVPSKALQTLLISCAAFAGWWEQAGFFRPEASEQARICTTFSAEPVQHGQTTGASSSDFLRFLPLSPGSP